jgi:hypothetical protein
MDKVFAKKDNFSHAVSIFSQDGQILSTTYEYFNSFSQDGKIISKNMKNLTHFLRMVKSLAQICK